MTIFLSVSGPAMAFDLAEFLATMSMGKTVTTAPVYTDLAVAPQPDAAPAVAQPDAALAVPVQRSRAANADPAPDGVWMIGVFR